MALIDLDDEIRPALPPRRHTKPPSPGSRLAATSRPSDDLAALIKTKSKPPPPVPKKPKRLSIATLKLDDESDEEDGHRITLIDLEDVSDSERAAVLRASSKRYISTPSEVVNSPPESWRPTLPTRPTDASLSTRSISGSPPNPFSGVSQAFSKFGAAVPVQTATKAIGKFSQDAQKTAVSVAQGTGKMFNEAGTAVTNTVRDASQQNDFLKRTTDDINDMTNRNRGQPGICSMCSNLPLALFFAPSDVQPTNIDSEMNDLEWASPLSRVIYHASWCRVCQLLLSMLCRPENDPLRHKDVAPFIAQPWLRGITMQRWLDEDWAESDGSWPFGYGEDRYEGSTNIYGQVSEVVSRAGPLVGQLAWISMIRSAKRKKMTLVEGRDLRASHAMRRAAAVRHERERLTKYPLPAVLVIGPTSQGSKTPGLLDAQLIGVRPSLDGELNLCFSKFVIQAVQNRFVFDLKAERSLFYGQVLDPNWINLHVAKLWLAECEHGHGKTCSEHGWAITLERPTFLRVIDVDELCIKEINNASTCRYIALSYVWGQADMLKLRYNNRQALMQPMGLSRCMTSLPRTILDAMEVVKSAGERYLWADALSILQEDTEESHEHIGHMDRVYGSALFTIVAANGTDANSGLEGVKPHYFERSSPSRQRTLVQPRASVNEKFDVIAPFQSQQKLGSTLWSSRAWTFQEQMLSRRLLVFANNEMTWHCRTRIHREAMSHEPAMYAPLPMRWLSLKPQHFGVATTNEHWTDGSIEVTRHGLSHVVRSDTFTEFAKVVREYSRRKMTYAADAINALSGLLRIFSLSFQSECVFGLPTALLDVGLLWRPRGPLERRPGFPSWSWAGWSGELGYDDPIRIRRDDSGQSIEVEGIRPLIRWHTFEPKRGTLLPINGTGYGLPLIDESLPREWDIHPRRSGCRDLVHNCQEPDLFDLPAAAIASLSSQCLIFWTSCSRFIRLGDQLTVAAPQDRPGQQDGSTHILWGGYSNRIGHVQFDDRSRADDSARKGFKMMIIAETLLPIGHPDRINGSYALYQFMAIQHDGNTGLSSRVGLGVVEKSAWRDMEPQLELMCLG